MFSLSAMGQHTLTGTIKNQQQQPVLGASVSLAVSYTHLDVYKRQPQEYRRQKRGDK